MKRNISIKLMLVLMTAMLIASTVALQAFAEEPNAVSDGQPLAAASVEGPEKAKRTIMLYACGADLESRAGMVTYNLRQILRSSFSSDDDIRFIVMTGGSSKWKLPVKNLQFTEGVNVPGDAVELQTGDPEHPAYLDSKSQISNAYNQLWEAKGADAPENAGKLVLLDGDGITGAEGTAVRSDDELMSDPDTLKAFIDYCAANYPAEKYDLILWDHGGGPVNGFGIDEHYSYSRDYEKSVYRIMSFKGIVDALAHNKVVDSNGDGVLDGRFDFVDFDACLMGNFELALALADYADYYIASAEVEPGYGQYYGPRASVNSGAATFKGWLDELGNDPSYDTFELGKIIVDDYIEFYSKEEGEGSMQDGTLAVFDLQKMIAPETGFLAAITKMGNLMRAQATQTDAKGRLLFYDELRSFFNAFENGDMQLFDLAGGATMLGVVSAEVYPESIAADGSFVDENVYTELSRKFYQWFRPDLPVTENEFMYGNSTLEIKTGERFYQGYDGDEAGVQFGTLYTSGLSLYFPRETYAYSPIEYYWALDPVLESMPVKNDGRYALLKGHEEVVADYALILLMGRTVDQMLNYPYDDFEVADRNELDADTVLNFWRTESGAWQNVLLEHFEKREDGEAATVEWLRTLINQQVADAVFAKDVSAAKIKLKDGEGYRVTVNGVNKRIAMNAERHFIPELPAVKEYAESLTDEKRSEIEIYGSLSVGSGRLSLDSVRASGSIEDWVAWFDEKGGVCDVGAEQSEWYVVKDAEGNSHIASIYLIDGDWIYVPALVYGESSAGGEDQMILLEFHKGDSDTASHELATVYYLDPAAGPSSIDPKRFEDSITVMPALCVRPYYGYGYFVPISKSPFAVSSANANSITLEIADVRNITDIEDVNGDGKVLDSAIFVTDIYGYQVDVTDAVSNPTDPELTHIELAEVAPGKCTRGSSIEAVPVVTYNGEVLKDGVDYTWEKDPKYDEEEDAWVMPTFTKAGSYGIVLTGNGRFAGTTYVSFKVTEVPPVDIEDYKSKAALSKASYAYTGKAIEPAVAVSGLDPSCYTVSYTDNKEVGTAKVTITGRRDKGYTGTIAKTFEIVKAKNPLAVKGKTVKLKASALKSKAKKLKVSKVVKFTGKGKGGLVYKKAKGKKGISINKKTGTVILKKGLAAGTYKVKVKIKAAGDRHYKPAAKSATFKITVR